MKIKTPPIKWAELKDGIEIDIPIGERTVPLYNPSGLTDVFIKTVTIYNDIPADNVTARHWDKHLIYFCNIQGGFIQKINGTIVNTVNAKTVITRDVTRYRNPIGYDAEQDKTDIYTVRTGDFVVFGEVDDVVSSPVDFANLQKKYADNGIKITNVNVGIFGMETDNISMTNA